MMIVLIVIPSPSAIASEGLISILVRPVLDGDQDERSVELSRDIIEAMRMTTPHHLIDFDKAADVLNYHESKKIEGGADEVQRILERAKESFFNFVYSKATEDLKKVIDIAGAKSDEMERYGPILLDAYISLAIVSKSQGKADAARDALASALRIDPLLNLSERDYPPSLIFLLDEVRDASPGEHGAIKIATRPPAMNVYLNGIPHGVTPLELGGLPDGTYSISIRDGRYRTVNRSVSIHGNTVKISERMRWETADGAQRDKSIVDAGAEVSLALAMADALKADKSILIDVDSAEEGDVSVRARMVDREFRVGLRPISISKDIPPAERYLALADLVMALNSQVGERIEIDPARKIDPPGVSDPVLMGKRRRSLTRSPYFWGAVGLAAAGAIAGGIAAAMSGDPSSTGAIRVNFK